jgi:quercetin dioxygenase-like cupin family protein
MHPADRIAAMHFCPTKKMDMKFPHIINSPGEKITFLRSIVKDGKEVIEGEVEMQPKGGTPMHTHHRQDESFTVVSGKLAYKIKGEEVQYAYPGDTVLIKAGVAHKFWNAGDEVLRCTCYVTPPENFVYFLTELYKSINANGGKPGMYDGAFLLNRYKAEFAIHDIPGFVQKVIFPVVLRLGNLAGKGKKYSNAPAPVVA